MSRNYYEWYAFLLYHIMQSYRIFHKHLWQNISGVVNIAISGILKNIRCLFVARKSYKFFKILGHRLIIGFPRNLFHKIFVWKKSSLSCIGILNQKICIFRAEKDEPTALRQFISNTVKTSRVFRRSDNKSFQHAESLQKFEGDRPSGSLTISSTLCVHGWNSCRVAACHVS